MEQERQASVNLNEFVKDIPSIAIRVMTNSATFFREMPKAGGFMEPIVFAAAMGLASGIASAILAIFGLGYVHSFLGAISYIILMPIVAPLFGFIGALILFVIWKILGSQESYETAYRCGAYASAITPITTLLNAIPYIGAVVGLLWMTYVIVVASSEVHRIDRKKAWTVFGIIFIIFAIGSITSQFAARRLERKVEKFKQEMGKEFKNLSPEEQKKAAQEFLEQIQKQQEKK
ncbi:MAG: hypothetical protein DRH12_12665 [Deltaproteobacteria bacterium]|nr:MAG: hypothetical protein DRH12_12665 [Deltaproteobacteria bacterium]RLB84636.1 MAG: hypothetical protein DRH15_04495 [Deltaproteobacteria bacterium]